MTRFETIKGLLASATTAGKVGPEMILRAEEALGVRFPPAYTEFLSQFGAALCDGFEIAGLVDPESNNEPPLWSNVVLSTVQLREASNGLIPHEYIFVSSDGGDYYYYLDTSRPNAQGECPVIVLGPGADAVIVAEDFYDFIIRSFEGSVSF